MNTFTIKIPKPRIPNIFRRKATEQPTTGIIQFMMQNPVWTETDLKNLAIAGFQNCMTVFACVGKIAKGAGGIPWILFRKARSKDSKRVQLFDNKILRLIERPNEDQGQSRFIEGVTGFYYIAGNSYTLRVGPESPNTPPKELYWLYPHQVQVLPGSRYEPVKGFRYLADATSPDDYEKDEVLHLKSFHPTNYWYGLSPLRVAARGIDTLNTAEEWNMKLIQNEMRPSGAIKVEGRMNEPQRKTFRREIMESLAGSSNAGVPLILEGGQEWMPFSISPKDADWLNSQTLTIRQVCLTLGIDPALMGDTENKTYSNMKESRRALYEETILPFMDFLRDEFNNWLTPRFGDNLELDYDRDSIEALKEEREAVFTRAQGSTFLTINEKRMMTGFDDIGPQGDIIHLPINMVPLGQGGTLDEGKYNVHTLENSLRGLLTQGSFIIKANNNKSFWTIPEKKRALWDNFVLLVKAKEKPFEKLAMEYLIDLVKRLKSNMESLTTLTGFYPSAILKVGDEAEEYRKKMFPWYVEAFAKGMDAGEAATKGELYELDEKASKQDLPPEIMELLNQSVLETGTQVNETLLDDVYRVWAIAELEGWGLDRFKAELPKKITELSPGKARVWAQTQSAKIENWSNVEGYKRAEFVERKGWGSAFAPTTRDSHARTNGQEVLLNEPFMIDGQVPAMYPGASGKPEHDINCLCHTYPVIVKI